MENIHIMIKYLSKFLYVLPTEKKRLIPLLVLFLFSPFLDTMGISLIGPFIKLATNPESINQSIKLSKLYNFMEFNSVQSFVILIGCMILFLFYSKSILYLKIQKYIYSFSYGQQRKLRLKLMNNYLSAPYTFHLKTNTATLIQNSFNESNRFCNNILLPLLQGLSEFVVVLFLILLLAYTDLGATITIAVLLLGAFLIYNQFRGKLAYLGKEASESQAMAIRVLNHALGGFKETRVIGCERYFVNQMDEQAQRYINAGKSYHMLQIVPRIIVEVLLITFLIGFTAIFFILERDAQDLNSILSIFAVASIRLIPSVTRFMTSLGSLRNSNYTLKKLYFEMKEIEQLHSSKKNNVLNINNTSFSMDQDNEKQQINFTNKIFLEQVNYRYPNTEEYALINICLDINKNSSVALIGKSGSGKTTLVDVILGLLIPESGDIKVDQKSIYSNMRSWQNLVGYIPQSIFLIDDTLERNIAFGVPDQLIDSGRLNNAIQAAQLEELVEQLPDGLKTVIGERGVRLSGGQRQRVGIARALYHEREILVMDEATSALDSETESLVTEAIKSLSGTKTMIIIAHRLSTIEHCDWVYVLEQGRIVKSGTYQEVVVEEQMLHGSDNHEA